MKIKTHGIKYIGSKKTIIPDIVQMIKSDIKPTKDFRFIDVFTGTTRVAQAARRLGWHTTTSDLSWASEAYSNTFVCNPNNHHLQEQIDHLNSLEGSADWLTNNYCGVDDSTGTNVKVWQSFNGEKADAIRNEIENMSLEPWEKFTLITSLIFALDKVDNTVGIQQAYLKEWCDRSFNKLTMELPPHVWDNVPMYSLTGSEPPRGNHIVGNALEIDYPESDLAYLDPPYSPHSYATYYHIWDSITAWDKPEVTLKTNRRKDRSKDHFDESMKSPWNQKASAVEAFDSLIDRLPVKHILISYSDESLVKQKDLIEISERHGEVTVNEINYKRNIMSSIGNATLYNEDFKTENKELLVLIKKY